MRLSTGFFVLALFCAAQSARRLTPVDQTERTSFRASRKIAVLVGVGNYPTYSGIGQA